MTDFETLIDDYLSSQQFLFLDASIKEHAPGMLGAFAASCRKRGIASPEVLTIDKFENVLLADFPRLDVPLPIRRSAPELLKEFFGYLDGSGRFPAAASWTGWVPALEGRYQALFREDGSVKGETFKKKYTDVNRNDPCPCGSGKKYKKCCMKLIE